ncbi:MAG: molybdopterin-dependent oxidoreductase [Bacteroidales bacterium]
MTSRRDFIRIAGMGTGGLLLVNPAMRALSNTFFENGSALAAGTQTMTPTYCEVCFWKCAGWVHKNEEGKIWKITGNDEDQHSNGRFCPRGTGGVGMYYDEDRLKTPMIRTEERGKQVFRESTWDEAFDYIAEKMTAISEKYGPECMALLTHGSGGKYFGNLLKAYGSNAIAAPSYSQCRGPREVAFYTTFGEGVESPERTDIRDTECLVLIGSHLGENMHNGQVQEMSAAIDKGASIITVDPRYSTAASKSKYWLPIKPATDLALLLSWIHVIIYEGYIRVRIISRKIYIWFDQLREHVKNMTPEG